ncbi:MAG: hypothetical protein R3E14_01410 [Erythrobacter sp.]
MKRKLCHIALVSLLTHPAVASAQERPPVPLSRTVVRADQTTVREIVPPTQAESVVEPDAAVLRAVPLSESLRSMKVIRRQPLLALRNRPRLALGEIGVDMTPLFENPQAPINISRQLEQMGGLVAQSLANGEVVETDRGVIVSQFLAYQLRPSACANPASRRQLEAAGTPCFERQDMAAKIGRLGDASDPHFIADAGQRARATANLRTNIDAERAEIAAGIAQFRSMAANPARRAELEAELGRDEVARLAGLSDAELETEIIQSALIEVEELMFVPNTDSPEIVASVSSDQQLIRRPRALALPQNTSVDVEHELEERVLLAGFTLGRQKEWSRRVSVTIKTCLVSCERTYYLEGFAGFGYGIGLRAPIRMGGTYSYHRVGNREDASIAPVFAPVDGSAQDYAATGLPSGQIFRGQELVAELGGYAGVRYKIPFSSDEFRIDVGGNLAHELPAPFTDGNFRPPSPDNPDVPETTVIFPDPDLLGGLGNYGFAGVKLLPAVKVGLRSDRMRLLLADRISGRETWMENSGAVYPLAVDPADHSSRFSIGAPEYRLAFDLTPGLNPQLFVDIAVWDHDWNWQVWFPQIKVTLPPQGLDFACHKDTVCTREYRYSPTVTDDVAGTYAAPATAQEREVLDWRKAFESEYLAQCPYAPLRLCEVAIRGVAAGQASDMLRQLDTLANIGSYPSAASRETMNSMKIAADIRGKQIIFENSRAAVGRYGSEVFGVYSAFWTAECRDQACRNTINAMGEEYLTALRRRWAADQALSPQEAVFLENSQGRWAQRARTEIEASRTRTTPRSQRLQRTIRGVRLPQ